MRGQGRLFRRKHSGSWWISYYHRGQEIRESAKTTSDHKARALLRERLRTAGTQEFIGPAAQRVTFEDLAALYLTDYRLNGRRSLRDATRNVETLRGAFGIDRALDITADRIAAYTERRLEAGLKPASVNRELAALRRMFTLAIRAGKVATRPHIALLAAPGDGSTDETIVIVARTKAAATGLRTAGPHSLSWLGSLRMISGLPR